MASTTAAHRLVPGSPRSGFLFDLALTVALLAGSLALLSQGGIDPSRSGRGALDLLGVALAACSLLPLVAWRRFALGVFTVTATAGVLLAGLGYPLDLMLGPIAALYLLAASRERETPWTLRTTAAVVGLLIAYVGATAAAQGTFPGFALFHNVLAWAVAWFAGERTRLRREQIAEFRARALRTEREVERERLLAVAEERARIARDLHDSAGHAVNVIAVRAGAARLRHHEDPDPRFSPDSDRGGRAADSRGDRSHRRLAARARLCRQGRRDPDGARIDRHPDRAPCGGGLEVTVTNPVSPRCSPRPSGGHGLIGMRERASLLGGSLDTERANGEFRVRARVPYGGHPA